MLIYFLRSVFSIYILFLMGCASNIVKYSDNPVCLTTLEGNLFEYKELSVKYPCLFLKDGNYQKYIKGMILEKDSLGILFKQEKIGFHSFDPTFYSYDTLYGAVNETGKIIFGDVPEKFIKKPTIFIRLESINNPGNNFLKFYLNPNEPFALCVKPDDYIIAEIIWEFENADIYRSVDLPEIKFTVEEGKANYLGDIFINFKNIDDENVILIPYKTTNKNNTLLTGCMLGMIGSAVYVATNAMADADGIQILNIESKENFITLSELPLNPLTIYVKKLHNDNFH